jgi:phosphatidylglycerophosphate synthase
MSGHGRPPYDQRLAHFLVRPLARTPVHPSRITAASLVLGLAAAWLIAQGAPRAADWGAGLFALARPLDHFDGELARVASKRTRFGYYFDYATGALSYGLLFLGMGIGLAPGRLGLWALALGAAGTTAAVGAAFLNLDLDRRLDLGERDAVGYPRYGGFELEDGIYLLAPITWLGWLAPFFVAAGLGAAAYCLWTLGRVVRARIRVRD